MSSLDLATSVLGFLHLLVCVFTHEVVITSQDRSPLSGLVLLLKLHSFFQALVVLLLLLTKVVIIEARWIINRHRLLSFCNGSRFHLTKRTHQAQVVELADIFAGQRGDRPNVS